ncbi:two-component response regulator [Halalkalibacter wakoensis JCM 9140]|uniref:Two-component response regulator n=1 Tax=Halalkalibacter wakoensis JCM 9140 TaxID=1236970 RepID=W4PYT7_9BACI|nr:response regulator transcription factor [Halalkalibacter wakoensis]GAE24976.1 two-component response regulator [Halalkalibacter wakoensis JCM 9140]
MNRLLVVDDEVQMQRLISICLSEQNYHIDHASSGEEALRFLSEKHYDLMLLDVMMPAMSGYTVLEKIEQQYSSLPVILLTALGETEHIVKGLDLGADDYVTKPFEPSELRARVQAVLRRMEKQKHEQVNELFGVLLNEQQKTFTANGQVLPLTRKEYQILHRLFCNPGQVFTRDQLLELEWDGFADRYDRNIDTHIKNIREKVKSAGVEKKLIETVWGIGYKFAHPEQNT